MIGDKYLHMVVVQLMAHLSCAQIYEKNRISEKKVSETKSNFKVFCEIVFWAKSAQLSMYNVHSQIWIAEVMLGAH